MIYLAFPTGGGPKRLMGIAGFLGTCGSNIWNCRAATAWQWRLPLLAQGLERSWPAEEEPGARKPPNPSSGDGTCRLCQGAPHLTPSTHQRPGSSRRAHWWRACALKSELGWNSSFAILELHGSWLRCSLRRFHLLLYALRRSSAAGQCVAPESGSVWPSPSNRTHQPGAVGKLLSFSGSLFFHILKKNNVTGEDKMRFYVGHAQC